MWRTHIGRIVRVRHKRERRNSLLAQFPKEKIVEDIEQSRRLTDRRSFLLKGAAVGAGAIGASRLLAAPRASAERGAHEG